MKNGNEMSKEKIENEIGIKITDKEYEYLQMFCSDEINVIELLKVLLNYRYRLLQFYENRTNEIFEYLKKIILN